LVKQNRSGSRIARPAGKCNFYVFSKPKKFKIYFVKSESDTSARVCDCCIGT